MSEEKKTPAKKTEPSKGEKILNWFKTLPQRIAKPFKNMYYELKKVTWPSKERLISYSCIVLLFMLFMGVIIGLLDMGASAGVRALISATSGSSTAAAVETAADTAEEPTATEAANTEEPTATEAPKAEEATATEAPKAEEAAATEAPKAEEATATEAASTEEPAADAAAGDASEGK